MVPNNAFVIFFSATSRSRQQRCWSKLRSEPETKSLRDVPPGNKLDRFITFYFLQLFSKTVCCSKAFLMRWKILLLSAVYSILATLSHVLKQGFSTWGILVPRGPQKVPGYVNYSREVKTAPSLMVGFYFCKSTLKHISIKNGSSVNH